MKERVASLLLPHPPAEQMESRRFHVQSMSETYQKTCARRSQAFWFWQALR